MIKINLLQQKKAKPISIPFGWIFVAAYAVVVCVALYSINKARLTSLEEETNKLEEWKTKVKQVRQYTEQLKSKQRQKEILQRNKNAYEKLLSSSGGAGWTQVLLWFEELLKASKTVWLRDLRVEGDGRVQINGFSMAKKVKNVEKHRVRGITRLLEALNQKETQFRSPRLKRITWEPYKSETVASFELQAVLQRP